MATWLVAAIAWAAQDSQEELRRQVEDLRRRLEAQEAELAEQRRLLSEMERRLVEAPAPEPPPVAPAAQEEEGRQYSDTFRQRFGRHAFLGGYMDLEYLAKERRHAGRATPDRHPRTTFDPHRLIPLISADIADNLKFWTEIEIEHGNELEVEFAVLDVLVRDGFNLRGGILLDPIGRTNLYHDSPLLELTERPLVDQFVIPTTLREPGVGAFGLLDLSDWLVQYEIYVGTGFKGLEADNSSPPRANITRTQGLRNARPHRNVDGEGGLRDLNNSKALMGRLQITPVLGLDLGLSGHVGRYDEEGQNTLGLYAVDLSLEGGAVSRALKLQESWFTRFLFASRLHGEWAYADIERDLAARRAGIPGDLKGWFLEYNYRFMPDVMRSLLGPVARDESTFTFTTRYDFVDLSRANNEHRMLTLGLNFRPVRRTRINFDYQFNLRRADAGWLAGFATYF